MLMADLFSQVVWGIIDAGRNSKRVVVRFAFYSTLTGSLAYKGLIRGFYRRLIVFYTLPMAGFSQLMSAQSTQC